MTAFDVNCPFVNLVCERYKIFVCLFFSLLKYKIKLSLTIHLTLTD